MNRLNSPGEFGTGDFGPSGRPFTPPRTSDFPAGGFADTLELAAPPPPPPPPPPIC